VVDKTSCLAACPATVTTELLKDIRVGAYGSGPFRLTVVGETLYFYADDGIHGWELWKSDGTAAGTVLLKDINPGSYTGAHITWDWHRGSFINGASPGPFVAMGGTIYFYAGDSTHGAELWKSDGTAAGTVIVKDINTRPHSNGTTTKSSQIRCLTAVGTTLYFSADDGIHGNELWKSDGTAAGTVLVKDINFGETGGSRSEPSSSNPGSRQGEEPEVFAAIGNTIYFMAQSGSLTAPKLGNELWKSDGTEAGTVMVKDINPAMQSSSSGASGGAYWITVVGTTLFFWADDGTHGQELWTSDGTTAGTVMVKDIRPGFPSSQMGNLMVIGTTLYFSANDGTHGKELWKSDGTTAGTVMVKDINSGYGEGYSPTNAKPPTAIGTTIYFRANDGIHGDELWKSDGTAAGTVMVKDVNTGPDYSTGNYQSQMVTAYGTSYKYCGSTNCGSNSKDASLTVIDDVLYFAANDGIHGDELWTSDGTAAGTVMVADINSGAADAFPRPVNTNGNTEGKMNYMYYGMSDSWYPMFAVLNDMVFFAADDGTHGLELYALRKSSTATYSDDNGGSATGRTCKLCSTMADCGKCSGAGLCDECAISKFLAVGGGACLTSCPNGSEVSGRTCVTAACPDVTDCGGCSEAGKCDECKNSKFLAVDTTTCSAVCSDGSYSDDNGGSATGRKCMPCSTIPDCGKCSIAGLCDECENSKFLDVPTKTCSTVCPDGSYGDDNGGAATGRTCKDVNRGDGIQRGNLSSFHIPKGTKTAATGVAVVAAVAVAVGVIVASVAVPATTTAAVLAATTGVDAAAATVGAVAGGGGGGAGSGAVMGGGELFGVMGEAMTLFGFVGTLQHISLLGSFFPVATTTTETPTSSVQSEMGELLRSFDSFNIVGMPSPFAAATSDGATSSEQGGMSRLLLQVTLWGGGSGRSLGVSSNTTGTSSATGNGTTTDIDTSTANAANSSSNSSLFAEVRVIQQRFIAK
jgi:ELWxxDGT repeat protein